MLLALLACTSAQPTPKDSDPPSDTGTPVVTCPDGTVAHPFDTTAAGTDYGGLAGDVTLPTTSGDWSLAGTWTGCDGVLFVGVDPDDGYTQLLLDSDFSKLLRQGPDDGQVVLLADAKNDTATELAATLQGIVDDALANVGDDTAAVWADRVHVATVDTHSVPGWLADVFDTYQYAVVGVDRTQTIREVGYLADPTTSWTTAEWRTLGYELDLYDFEARRQAVLDSRDATVVRVFDAADTREADWTGAATVDLPDAATMAGFNRVDVDVTIACGGPWYDACPEWDTSDYFQRCATDDPATTDVDESTDCEEMARVITGYWRGGRWVMDARHQLPALLDGGAHTFRWAGSMSNVVTVDLRFWHEDGAPSVTGATQLWWETGDFWDATYDSRHADHTFTAPADATHLELFSIITGHGSDGEGCGEFCDTTQTFRVDSGALVEESFDDAGSTKGCAEQVATNGALPNQAGTWTYGRDGWCPGMGVTPGIFDVSGTLAAGAEQTLHYQALHDGAPYVTDGDGNLDVGVWVVWGR